MDALKAQRHKLNTATRKFLGQQLRLYYGILESETPPRFGEMLRELGDQSLEVVPLNASR